MSLARDLFHMEQVLRQNGKIDPFAPSASDALCTSPDCASLLARLNQRTLQAPELLRLCLQALRIQREELEPNLGSAEFVATLPTDAPGIARPTHAVVREMIESARSEIVLLGYELTDTGLLHLLASAKSRDVDVILICDRQKATGSRALGEWPQNTQRPRVFQDRARSGAAPYASMHAKALVIDGRDLLITSANFTFHGLQGNIEIGIRLSGEPANEARKLFSYLVETGIVEPCG